MIMPSIVSMVRILLRLSAFSAIRSVIKMDICALLDHAAVVFGRRPGRQACLPVVFGRRQRRELLRGIAPVGDLLIDLDPAVAEAHEPRAVFGDVHLVRDEQMVMPRSMFSRWKMPITSMLVRVSRLPVGSSARRIDGSLIERARDGDALLLAARELIRDSGGRARRGRRPSSASIARLWRSAVFILLPPL